MIRMSPSLQSDRYSDRDVGWTGSPLRSLDPASSIEEDQEQEDPSHYSVQHQADLMIQASRDRAALRFLQDWRREVVLLRYRRYPEHFLGRADCLFSAQSSDLRCAVHPLGPCEGCRHFEMIETGSLPSPERVSL